MGSEIASVWIPNFDRGVVTTIGSVLRDIEVDGDIRQHYVLPCDGLAEYPDSTNLPEELRPLPTFPTGTVPVFFVNPEEVFQPWVLPCVVVRRGSISPNFSRAPWFSFQNVPASDASTVAVNIGGQWITGPNKRVMRWGAIPHDIGYEVQVYARTQFDELKLLHCVMKKTRPPWFNVSVVDDHDCARTYVAGPVDVADLSELADVADRTIAHSISFDVWAELDLNDEVVTGEGNNFGVVTSLPEVTYRMFYPPPVVRPEC